MAAKRAKKTDTAALPAPAATETAIIAIKGFDGQLKCRGFQFEIGKTYKHDGPVVACESGFHAVEGHPLDVLGYYPPAGSRFCEVEQRGPFARHSDDSKVASAEITVRAEIHMHDLIQRAIKWVFDRSKPEGKTATGYQGAASATGNEGAASATGTRGAAMATGYRGAASATGYQGAALATGNEGAASATGTQGAALATGTQGAALATGTRGAASATSYQGAASATGNEGAASATGTRGAAMACGYAGSVSGVEGNALFLAERNFHGEIVAVWAGIAGRDGIKPNTFYALRAGKPVETEG
jgi:hypothetical protein